MKVVILIGSASDFNIVEGAIEIFKEFDIPFALEVTSAHRSPERDSHPPPSPGLTSGFARYHADRRTLPG